MKHSCLSALIACKRRWLSFFCSIKRKIRKSASPLDACALTEKSHTRSCQVSAGKLTSWRQMLYAHEERTKDREAPAIYHAQ